MHIEMSGHNRLMMLRGFLFLMASLSVVIIVGAMPSEGPDGTTEQELMETDRAFARATAERGLDGWVSYFTEDAARVVLDGRIARGHEGIRGLDGPNFADPSIRLTWEPTDAGLFAAGDHGFTRGTYRVVRVGTDGGGSSRAGIICRSGAGEKKDGRLFSTRARPSGTLARPARLNRGPRCGSIE